MMYCSNCKDSKELMVCPVCKGTGKVRAGIQRKFKYLALVLLFACATLGCAQDPRVVAFEAGKKSVNLDSRLLAECAPLERLKGRTEQEILTFVEDATTKYKECRAWKNELNKVVKDAFNLEKK